MAPTVGERVNGVDERHGYSYNNVPILWYRAPICHPGLELDQPGPPSP